MTTLPETDETARAWVEVDLGALVRNARRVTARAGARLLPMVKANGYGLGAEAVARALLAADPWGFGVATVEEGSELRRAGITVPLLLCTPLLARWIPRILDAALTPVIGDEAALRAWLAGGHDRPFHLLIDTGMTRGGFRAGAPGTVDALAALVGPAVGYEGICTHFHSADTSLAATNRQYSEFVEVVYAVGRPPLVHAANSAAALAGPDYAGDLVRPGIFIYGGEVAGAVPECVARLEARVVAVQGVPAGTTVSYGATWCAKRPTNVATLAIGYGDGLLRSLSSRGAAELGGTRVPILGRVTMDLTMVEAPDGTLPGDVATLYGGQVTLDQQAEAAGTIAYELLTALGSRLPRRYRTPS